MTTQITIHPPQNLEPQRHLSPHQRTMAKAPEIVNDDFLGSFTDLLDVVNPLQHIPGVSTAYSAITGDNAVSHGANIIGGAIFGGPIGLFASILNAIVEEATGAGIAQNLFASATNSYEKASKLDS